MSDIEIFDSNSIFVLCLLLLAPIGILLLLGYFFKSSEKYKTAKILFILAVIYTLIIAFAILFLTLS